MGPCLSARQRVRYPLRSQFGHMAQFMACCTARSKTLKRATLFLLWYKSHLIAACKVGTNQIMAVLLEAGLPVPC